MNFTQTFRIYSIVLILCINIPCNLYASGIKVATDSTLESSEKLLSDSSHQNQAFNQQDTNKFSPSIIVNKSCLDTNFHTKDTISTHDISICSDVPVILTSVPGFIDYLKIIASFLSIIIAGLAIILGQGFFYRKREYIRYLESKLNEFHRPITQALLTSSMLYDVLKEDKPEDFRALKYLIEKKEEAFDDTDKKIIKEIVQVGKEIEKIIDEHSGHILNENTRNEVAQLARHLRIFRVVAENNINCYSEKFIKFTYPRSVNTLIKAEYDYLQNKLERKTKRII